jgi:hypothetical protein
MKGEGGDEADDAMGGELGHVDEIDFRAARLPRWDRSRFE